MSAANCGFSPKVPLNLLHLGSVARSTCGDKAVAIPNALYSLAAVCPNFCTIEGSNVAAMPIDSGHIEIVPPEPKLYSAFATTPLRGSELLLAGIPKPMPSTNACTLLFHLAETSGLLTLVTNI